MPNQLIQPMQMIGPIGSFEMDGEQINGIELADVVAYVSLLPRDTKELFIDFATPGGLKDVGDAIYNYLMALRSRMTITFNQVGPIGSIGTKIIFAGQNRIALDDGTDNWFIHNPWTNQRGDAAALRARAEQMQPQEDELRNFYCTQTGIAPEGIAPLMSAETSFNADKAVAMKFATSKRPALKIAAYMKNKNTLGQRLDNLVALIQKAISPTLSMVVLNIAGGSAIAVNAPDPSSLKGAQAYTCDQAGNPTQTPAPDGTYQVDQDDMTFVVKGGVVTEVNDPDAANPAGPSAGQGSNIAAQVSAMVAAAATDPVKAKTLAADINALLAKPAKPAKSAKKDPEEEEETESKEVLAFVTKLEELLNPDSPKNLEKKLLLALDEKIKGLKSEIKTTKKPGIKVFHNPDTDGPRLSPAEKYLQN